MIKNLLFDMGGVIFNQNTEEAFRRFEKIGIDTNEYMGVYGQKDYFLDVENGKIDDKQFCRMLSKTVGREVSWEEAQHCWLGFFAGVPEQRLTALESLRKQGYHICLLSNTNPFIMAFTRSTEFCSLHKPITDYFDSFFCSYEMKVCKPDAEIFLKALAMDNMKAEECLFVDDSDKNTKAAELLGFHVLHTQTNKDWMEKVNDILGMNTHKGRFSAMAYYGDMEYPVDAEIEFNNKEAESIRKAIEEHNTEEDWPDLYDLEPSLAIQLRQAFIENCPEEFQMNAEMLDFDYLEFPEEFK